MSVHIQLRRLVSQHGQSVLHSSEDLRGLLDDYFSEDEITVGEVNLLVDAVRMSAFERLAALLAQGADPRVAVEAAGRALAEERSGDPRTAAWACAALGYAVGSIPEAIVLAYGSDPPRTSPPGQGHPTTPPAVPPQQAPEPPTVVQAAVPAPLPPPPWQRTAEPAPGQRSVQPPPPAQRAAPPPPPWPVPSAPQRRGRGGWLVAGALGLATVVVAVLVVIGTVGGDNDRVAGPGSNETAGESGGSISTGGPVGTRPPGSEVPLAELTQNYASLGSTLAADAQACEALEPRPGTVERLRCTYEHLPVVYTTYADVSALEAARSKRLSALSQGTDDTTDSNVTAAGAYVLRQGATNTSLYWDAADDLQSGQVTAPVERLYANAAKNWFDQRGDAAATRELPAAVDPFTSDALWAHARDFLQDQVGVDGVEGCESIPNLNAPFPQQERIECFDGDIKMVFVSVEGDLSAAREHFDESAETNKTWNWFGEDAEVDYPAAGLLMRTYTSAGAPVLYWDDTAQRVYGFIFAPNGDYSRAEAHWQAADASSS